LDTQRQQERWRAKAAGAAPRTAFFESLRAEMAAGASIRDFDRWDTLLQGLIAGAVQARPISA
jgi:hypothetical protein